VSGNYIDQSALIRAVDLREGRGDPRRAAEL